MNEASCATFESSVLIARRPADVWERVRGAGRLPGRVLGETAGEKVRFVHEGVRGWLPVGEVVGEYRLEPATDGVRLHLGVWAPVPEGAAGRKARSLLAGWVSGTLAARAAELSALVRAA